MNFAEYALTPADQGLLAPLTEQILALDTERLVILRAILRREKLAGDGWRLEGDKLIRDGGG
jgi:hypothetical protein